VGPGAFRSAKDISAARNAIASTLAITHAPGDMDEYEEAILFTFGKLESRLDRLEYVLSGPKAQGAEKPKSIPDRIHMIERSLQALNGKTSLLADAQELRMPHRHLHIYGS
jgi:hypothetical protein